MSVIPQLKKKIEKKDNKCVHKHYTILFSKMFYCCFGKHTHFSQNYVMLIWKRFNI